MKNGTQLIVRLGAGAVLAATLFLTPTSAVADQGVSNTYNFDDSYCFLDTGSGINYCYDNHNRLHTVQNNERINAYGKGTSTYSEISAAGTVTYSDTLTFATKIP